MTYLFPQWSGIQLVRQGNQILEKFICRQCGRACSQLCRLRDKPENCIDEAKRRHIEEIRRELHAN